MPCLINSVTHGSYAPQVTSYITGDAVTVSCDLGYSPPKTDLICQNDGNWSPKWPSCALTGKIYYTIVYTLRGGGGGGAGVQGQKSWKHDFEITGDPKGPPSGSTSWSGFEAPDS